MHGRLLRVPSAVSVDCDDAHRPLHRCVPYAFACPSEYFGACVSRYWALLDAYEKNSRGSRATDRWYAHMRAVRYCRVCSVYCADEYNWVVGE